MYTLFIWLWSNIFDFVSKLHNNYIIQLLYEWPICAISCATLCVITMQLIVQNGMCDQTTCPHFQHPFEMALLIFIQLIFN
jgi:hypothetical protein